MRGDYLVCGPIGENEGFYNPTILNYFLVRILSEFYGTMSVSHPSKDEASIRRLIDALDYMLVDLLRTAPVRVSDHCILVEFYFIFSNSFLLASWNDGSLPESEIVPGIARELGLALKPLLPAGLGLERAFDRIFEVEERDAIMGAIAQLPSQPEPTATMIIDLVKRSFAIFHVLFAYYTQIGLGDGSVFDLGSSKSIRLKYVHDLLAEFRKAAENQSDEQRFDTIAVSFLDYALLCRTFRLKRVSEASRMMR